MKITLRQLHIFVSIARAGSTANAAKKIALSQSATSAALNQLEDCLGVRLFDRVGKNLVLNENGQVFLLESSKLIDAAYNLESMFHQGTGHSGIYLRLGASTTIGNHILPRIISGYRTNKPGCRVSLDIVGNTREVASAVAHFDVDIGFIEGPCHENELTVTPWLSDEFVIVCSPQHWLAQKYKDEIVPLAMLEKSEWLIREHGSGTREFVERSLLGNLIQLKEAITIASSEAMKWAVADGMAIACMSRHIVKDFVESGRLTILQTELPVLTRRLYVIMHKQKTITQNIQQFLEICRLKPDHH